MRKCCVCGLTTDSEKICGECGCFVSDEVMDNATPEDYLEVLNGAKLQLNSLETLYRKIDATADVKMPPTAAHVTIWKYLWPWLVAAGVCIVISNVLDAFYGMIVLILGLLIAFVGFLISRSKRNEYNYQAEKETQRIIDKYYFDVAEHDKYIRYAENTAKYISYYKKYMPENMLREEKVDLLMNCIQYGGAKTIAEALQMIPY